MINKSWIEYSNLDESFKELFDYFQEAYNFAEAGNFKLEKSYAARHLSYLYDVKKGDLDKSLYYAKASLELRKEIGLKIFLPSQYLSVGVIYLLKKDVEQALKYLQIAYDRAAEINYKRTVISSLIYLGDVYHASLSPAQQKEALLEELKKHQANEEQRDDISIIGISMHFPPF